MSEQRSDDLLGGFVMRRTFVLLTLATTAALTGATLRAEPPAVDRLVERLGSDRYDERQEATKALDALGPLALDALRKASESPDPEVRRRATALVRQIQKRLDVDTTLAPRKLRLDVKDAPLSEVVAELRKKSRFDVQLDPKLAEPDRKVTLDTGEVSFWEALDKLCAAAGLVDGAPQTPPEPANPNNFRSASVVIIGGGVRAIPSDIMKPDPPEKEEVILLTDGKDRPRPTHFAGAARVSVLPPTTSVPGHAAEKGESVLALEVMVEPRLKWLQTLSARVTKAVDDHGQTLTGRLTFLGKPAVPRGGASVFVNGQPVYPDEPGPEGRAAGLTPLRLLRGEKAAQTLTELQGSLIGLVQSEPEDLVTVDGLMKATGKGVKGVAGASLKVLETVKSEEDGLWVVRFLVESPPRQADDGTAGMAGGGLVMINGRVVTGASDEPVSALNFSLLDEQGKEFKVERASNTGKRAGAARELELAFKPADGQGDPAKLVYRGRRTSVVEVPFAFKDVPLP